MIVVVGAGIVCLILVLLFFRLGYNGRSSDEGGGSKVPSHYPLQILILGFILTLFLIIGKASLDESDQSCAWLVNQSTTSGANVTYTYDYSCNDNGTTTGESFYSMTVWIMRLFGIYLFGYLVFAVLSHFGYVGGKMRGREQ